MNELIKTLTFEAGATLYSKPPKRAVTGVVMTFEQVEKLAQLILNECHAQCIATALMQDNAQTRSAAAQCAVAIKQRFGVE